MTARYPSAHKPEAQANDEDNPCPSLALQACVAKVKRTICHSPSLALQAGVGSRRVVIWQDSQYIGLASTGAFLGLFRQLDLRGFEVAFEIPVARQELIEAGFRDIAAQIGPFLFEPSHQVGG